MTDTKKLAPWIETYTGRHFYFLNPEQDQIAIEDIAHSLAFTCRYTGHSNRFYSVAEHSILVSYLASDPLAGLLHDASEAYITDIASPIKPYLSNYKELEDMLMARIAKRFGFDYPLDEDIKDCDNTQLKTEAKHLLRSGGYPWAHLYPTKRPHGITPNCWSPEEAEKKFLERFEEVRKDYVKPLSPGTLIPVDAEYFNNPWRSLVGLLCTSGSKSSRVDPSVAREANYGGQNHHCGEDARRTYLRPEEFTNCSCKTTSPTGT